MDKDVHNFFLKRKCAGRRSLMLLESLMKIEIGKLYARIATLEHLGRQMIGTMEVLQKTDKISSLTMEEILEKWRSELKGKKRRKVA